jgi:pyruvyltransferase
MTGEGPDEAAGRLASTAADDGRRLPALRAAYFTRVPNVGDRVTPLVLEAITGRPVRRISDLSRPHILSVGSLMAWATPASQIWGTGVIDPEGGVGRSRKGAVHALRGPLTHRALRRGGVALADVPFGDPGFLAPALLGVTRSGAPTFPVGLVAHYLDRHDPGLRAMLTSAGVADLDVSEPPAAFLGRMADCAAVISTSLHGLVFAEALGIPSLWVKAGDRLIGGDFKFADWFATTARPQARPHLLAPGDTALALAARAELRESLIDPSALRAAFPMHQLDDLQSDEDEAFGAPGRRGVVAGAKRVARRLARPFRRQ